MAAGNLCDNGAHLPYGEATWDRCSVLFQTSDFLELAKNVPFPDKTSVYNIGDYGTVDGAASMGLMRKLIESLKQHHGSEVQFQIIYEGQEVNDFNSLFRRLSGLIPESPSYLQDFENVFAFASGTNFYKQCVPTDSMHIIYSGVAVHWLSGKPPVNNNDIFPFPNTNDNARYFLEKQASDDWEKFLILRSRELEKGGLLVVSIGTHCTTSSGEIKCTAGNFLSILNTVWKSFRDMGKNSQQELLNTNMAFCDRSLALLEAPFDDPESKVSKSNLCLIPAKQVFVPCNMYKEWRQRKEQEGVDDRSEFARQYVSAHRCWSNSAFLTGLSGTRSKDEKELIVDEFYAQVKEVIRNMNPEDFRDEYLYCYVFIIKE